MNINTKILQKRAKASYWKDHDFIPDPGELIVYLPDNDNENVRLKIGDGVTNLSALRFLDIKEVDGYDDGVVNFNLTLDSDGKLSFEGEHTKELDEQSEKTAGMTSNESVSAGTSKAIALPHITVDDYGHVRTLENKTLTITIPEQITDYLNSSDKQNLEGLIKTLSSEVYKKTEVDDALDEVITNFPSELKNPHSLTIGNITYDGSSEKTVTLADLGLSSAMKFIGVTTDKLTDGSKVNPVKLNGGVDHTAVTGHVVMDTNALEYVWDGSCWQQLGSGESYKKLQTPVDGPSSQGSPSTTFISSISQNAEGVISSVRSEIQWPNYALSESVGGPATSALKLNSARQINIVGSTTSSTEFDGSKDITINMPKISSDNITSGDNVLIFDCGSSTENID
jgi:hypothetical protein